MMYLAPNKILIVVLSLFIYSVCLADAEYNSLYNKAVKSGTVEDAEVCVQFAIESGEKALISNAYFIKGYNAYNSDMYYNALNSYFSALKSYRSEGNDLMQAAVIENIGIIYEKAYYFDMAINYYSDAIKIKIEHGADAEGIARSYYNIGRVYRQADKFDMAVISFNKALMIYTEQKDAQMMSQTNNELGIAYVRGEKYDSAKLVYDLITDGFEEGSADWIKRETLRLNNMASLHNEMEEYGTAKSYVHKGLSPEFESDVKPNIKSLLYFNLAEIHEYENDTVALMLSYEQGLRDVSDQDYDEDVLEALTLLAEMYEKRGDAKKSIVYYKKIAGITTELALLQNELQQKSIKYQVDAATYKKEKELAAAAEVQTKMIYAVVNGLVAAFVLLMAQVLYTRYQRKQEILKQEASNIIDDIT